MWRELFLLEVVYSASGVRGPTGPLSEPFTIPDPGKPSSRPNVNLAFHSFPSMFLKRRTSFLDHICINHPIPMRPKVRTGLEAFEELYVPHKLVI